jgi:hypothetical protein
VRSHQAEAVARSVQSNHVDAMAGVEAASGAGMFGQSISSS